MNVIVIGALAYLGAQFMSYELTAEILNFGAFLGFMCVNLAAFWKFGVQQRSRKWEGVVIDAALPLLGFIFCAAIWWGLATPAKITGSIWLLAGVAVLGVRSNWFREPLRLPDPTLYE